MKTKILIYSLILASTTTLGGFSTAAYSRRMSDNLANNHLEIIQLERVENELDAIRDREGKKLTIERILCDDSLKTYTTKLSEIRKITELNHNVRDELKEYHSYKSMTLTSYVAAWLGLSSLMTMAQLELAGIIKDCYRKFR